jgi:hypothetical protein
MTSGMLATAIRPTVRISSSSVVCLRAVQRLAGPCLGSVQNPDLTMADTDTRALGAYGPGHCCGIESRHVLMAKRYAPRQPPRYVHVDGLAATSGRMCVGIADNAVWVTAESESPAACSLRRMMGFSDLGVLCRVRFLGREGSGPG